MVRSGVGNLSAGEIVLRIGHRTGESFARGVTGGLGDFGAQQVTAGRRRRAQRDQDADEQMEGMAHDPNRLPEGQHAVASHTDSETHEARILAVVRVNDDHALSVVRHPDGTISVTICSNGCGRIRQLLQAAQSDHAAQPDHPIHSQIRPLLDEVAEIEAQLRVNPEDERVNLRLQELARRVNTLLGRVGEQTVFGPRPDDETQTQQAEEQTGTAGRTTTGGTTAGQTERLKLPERRARALEVATQAAADDELAGQGFQRMQQVFRDKALGDIVLSLVEESPEQLIPFMRALRDPVFTEGKVRQLGRRGFVALIDKPEALTFLRAYGGEALFHIYNNFGWDTEVLAGAAARINSAQTTEARAQLIQELLAANTPLRIRRFLFPPPPPVPLPTATAENMGINRDHPDWIAFHSEVEAFAASHKQQGASHEQLQIRADLEMVLSRARNGDLQDLTPEQKRGVLNRYDEMAAQEQQLAIAAGHPELAMLYQWINARRGNLAEYLFIPVEERLLGKPAFINGRQVQPGESREGSTIPDYSTTETGVNERVNIKSDLIDRGTRQRIGAYQNGVDAARAYRDWAIKAVTQLPAGDKLSIDFIHDPGEITRLRMLQILFDTGSPVYRVKFGDRWYTRADLR